MSATFVPVKWSCDKCQKRGVSEFFQRPNESRADAIVRQAVTTRWLCVPGCRFTAEDATPEKEHV